MALTRLQESNNTIKLKDDSDTYCKNNTKIMNSINFISNLFLLLLYKNVTEK